MNENNIELWWPNMRQEEGDMKPDDRGWDGWLAVGGNVTYALVFCLLQIMGKPYSSEEF